MRGALFGGFIRILPLRLLARNEDEHGEKKYEGRENPGFRYMFHFDIPEESAFINFTLSMLNKYEA
jgi:hypothetical protein